jgi:hypothetical protein
VHTLYAEVALALCGFVCVALRYLIVGERFDRALHRVDPLYRNLREIARGLLIDPIDAGKGLPRAYGRYYGHVFRRVDDAEVERLRRQTVRAFLDVSILGFGWIVAVFAIGAFLRRVSPTLHDVAVISAVASLLLYWVLRLIRHLRDPDGSTMIALYILGGVAAVIAAAVFILDFSSRAA